MNHSYPWHLASSDEYARVNDGTASSDGQARGNDIDIGEVDS